MQRISIKEAIAALTLHMICLPAMIASGVIGWLLDIERRGLRK